MPDNAFYGVNAGKPDFGGLAKGMWQVPYIIDMQKQGRAPDGGPVVVPFNALGKKIFDERTVGHWDGDTLVVDTIGMNDKTWLDAAGHPHGEKLHVTEKFTRPDSNTLRLEATIDDPDYYTKPWTVVTTSRWAPGQELMEYICQENNKDLQHLVGK